MNEELVPPFLDVWAMVKHNPVLLPMIKQAAKADGEFCSAHFHLAAASCLAHITFELLTTYAYGRVTIRRVLLDAFFCDPNLRILELASKNEIALSWILPFVDTTTFYDAVGRNNIFSGACMDVIEPSPFIGRPDSVTPLPGHLLVELLACGFEPNYPLLQAARDSIVGHHRLTLNQFYSLWVVPTERVVPPDVTENQKLKAIYRSCLSLYHQEILGLPVDRLGYTAVSTYAVAYAATADPREGKRLLDLILFRRLSARMLEICAALQGLELPALVTCTILDCSWHRLSCLVPMHLKWKLATGVKHFRSRQR